MNEQLSLLIALQEIDTEILLKTSILDKFPARLNESTDEIRGVQRKEAEVKARLDRLIRQKKDKDSELEERLERIAKLKDRTKDIKTNVEYQAHLKEIASAEAARLKAEDEVLAIMESIESSTRELKAVELLVREEDNKWNEVKKKIEEEGSAIEAEVSALKHKRKEVYSRLPEDMYRRYMELLTNKKGLAVVLASDEVCSGCHTNIPPQLYSDLNDTEEILSCPHCHRLLYRK